MIKSIKNSQNLMEIPQNFMKNSQTLMKNSKKFHLSCFSPTSYQRRRIIGNFKNRLWCTMDETQGAKIQIWGTGHKLTSLRNSGNFILSIFMHRGQRYDSAKFSSCYLNTLYVLSLLPDLPGSYCVGWWRQRWFSQLHWLPF